MRPFEFLSLQPGRFGPVNNTVLESAEHAALSRVSSGITVSMGQADVRERDRRMSGGPAADEDGEHLLV